MTPEEKNIKRKQKEETYYNLTYYLRDVRDHMQDLEGYRSNSTAFKMLMIALDAMCNQVREDYKRYEKVLDRKTIKEEFEELTESYNREKLKNIELEKKIEEAKTSSGLFIDFVRDKLNLK